MPTFFGRNLDKCKQFARVWYGQDLSAKTDLPCEVVYSLDHMNLIDNLEQMELVKEFVADLEASFGTKQHKVSFDQLWAENPPKAANGLGLQEYMKDVSRDSFFYEDHHKFDTFRQQYHDAFGKTPYVSPPVRWQW